MQAGDRQGPFRSRSFRVTLGNGGGDLRINGRRRDTPDRSVPVGYLVRSSGTSALPSAPACRRAGDLLSVRAGVVVTGTEVLSGRVQDRNGPWLADRLAELGVELAHVMITGDRREDLLAALNFMRAEGTDLILTSGGLGPTADDMTAEIVADFAGRPLQLDEALERRIGEIIARFARRWNLDPKALEFANRKQAMVPEGAVALDPVGTAPGLVVPANGQVVVVLPGPPRELQESWRQAVGTDAVPAGRGRRAALPADDGPHVRRPRVGDRRDAARRGRRDGPRRASRSRPACGARSSRS